MKKRWLQIVELVALLLIVSFTLSACKTEEQAIGNGKEYKLSLGDDDAEEVVLTLNSNGGASLSDIVVSKGDTVVLPSCTRSGYKFLYWTTSGGTQYQSGDSIEMDSDLTLTAQWEQDANAVIYGDVDNSGDVDALDRTTLARYIAEWLGYTADTINLTAADVNCDGSVDALDRTILARHIAEWPGYEELPYEK